MQRMLENYANLLSSKWHESNLIHLTMQASGLFAGKTWCDCVCSTNTLHNIATSLIKLAFETIDRTDTLKSLTIMTMIQSVC